MAPKNFAVALKQTSLRHFVVFANLLAATDNVSNAVVAKSYKWLLIAYQ